MTTERPYDYPGAPLHVTGRDNLSVELAYGTDDQGDEVEQRRATPWVVSADESERT